MVDFTVNGVLSIFAICSADANDDYTIRLWAPLEAEEAADDGRSRISGITSKSTKTEFKFFIFKKYLDYL